MAGLSGMRAARRRDGHDLTGACLPESRPLRVGAAGPGFDVDRPPAAYPGSSRRYRRMPFEVNWRSRLDGDRVFETAPEIAALCTALVISVEADEIASVTASCREESESGSVGSSPEACDTDSVDAVERLVRVLNLASRACALLGLILDLCGVRPGFRGVGGPWSRRRSPARLPGLGRGLDPGRPLAGPACRLVDRLAGVLRRQRAAAGCQRGLVRGFRTPSSDRDCCSPTDLVLSAFCLTASSIDLSPFSLVCFSVVGLLLDVRRGLAVAR